MVGEESNPEEATERRGPFSVLEFESSNMTISEMLAEALHAVRLHLDMDVAFIGEFREGQRIFRYVDGRASPLPIAENTGSPLDETYCQRLVDGRLPELIPDTGQLPASAFPHTPGVVVGAHLGVPIRFSDGSLFGTFGHGYTASSHPVATAVALENLKIIEERDLMGNARRLAPRLQDAGVDRWVRGQEHASDHAPTWVLLETAAGKR